MDAIMLHNDAAEKNARELIRMMQTMTNALITDRMYYSFRELEIDTFMSKVKEYNDHVKEVDSLCKEW